jgi:hypothetical protein
MPWNCVSYMSVDLDEASTRERWIRVAAMVIVIAAGSRDIYVSKGVSDP